MIYAVNIDTKAHRVIERWQDCKPFSEKYVQADAGGWIAWEGRECPLPEDSCCDVKLKGGTKLQSRVPLFRWTHDDDDLDIIAYRPILDKAEKSGGVSRTPIMDSYREAQEKPDEWSGEGLPPVGAEFEFSANGKFWEERVMLFNDGITCLMAHRKFPANRWHYKAEDPDLHCRPIRTERERWVDAAMGFAKSDAETLERKLCRVYDAGLARLPE